MDIQPQPTPPQVPPNGNGVVPPPSQPTESTPAAAQPSVNPQIAPSAPFPPQPEIGGVVVNGSTVSQPINNTNQFESDSKANKLRLPLMIGIGIVVLILIAGSIFAFIKHESSTSVAECGKVVVTNKTFEKSPFSGCFDEHFVNCSPAQIVIDNESSILKGTVNQYNIKAKQGSSCLVQWQYVALPANKSWDGKTITCAYTENKDFEKSLDARTSFKGCTGPLVSIASSGQSSQSTSSSGSTTTGSTKVTSGTSQTTTNGSSSETVTNSSTTSSTTSASQTSQ